MNKMLELIYNTFTLLIAFQIKHFVCDYLLQNKYMLGKFKTGFDWILPLTAHAAVHAIGTLLIIVSFLYYNRLDLSEFALVTFKLAIFDFTYHAVMDRIKANPNFLGRYEALSKNEYINLAKYIEKYGMDERSNEKLRSNRYFWYTLGLDQLVHHLTHYLIIAVLIRDIYFS